MVLRLRCSGQEVFAADMAGRVFGVWGAAAVKIVALSAVVFALCLVGGRGRASDQPRCVESAPAVAVAANVHLGTAIVCETS